MSYNKRCTERPLDIYDLVQYPIPDEGMQAVRCHKVYLQPKTTRDVRFEMDERKHTDGSIEFHYQVNITCLGLLTPGKMTRRYRFF